MTALPPELASFSDLLDAQPAPVRNAFQHCLCVLMTQAGVMHLVEKVPGENGVVCVFAATRGDHFIRTAVGWKAEMLMCYAQ